MVYQKDLASVVSLSGLLASIARALAQSMLAMVCASVAILIDLPLMRGIVYFLENYFVAIRFNRKDSVNSETAPTNLNLANLNKAWISRSLARPFDLVKV